MRYVAEGFAVPGSLHVLHDLLERAGRENPHVCAEDILMLETAVIELAGNLVEHGRPPGEVVYRCELVVYPDRVEAVLTDSGEPGCHLPAASDMPDELEESGRGLLLAQLVVHQLTYSHVEGSNVWQMVRQLQD